MDYSDGAQDGLASPTHEPLDESHAPEHETTGPSSAWPAADVEVGDNHELVSPQLSTAASYPQMLGTRLLELKGASSNGPQT